MPRFGKLSKARLVTCDERLERLMNEVIKRIDFTVVCGFRGPKDQDEAYLMKRSKLRWPDSKHNRRPSLAVDIAPCDDNGIILWNSIPAFKRLAEIVMDESRKLGIPVVWGGSWKWKDYPHWELK